MNPHGSRYGLGGHESGVPRPVEINTSEPQIARVYDYVLGGKDNYDVDREAWHALAEKFPGIGKLATANRAFLGRAVRFLAQEAGIRQFIDVGSGLPTAENVHQIAQAVDPAARVVYVDKDPIVLAYGRARVGFDDATVVIQADGADPDSILDHPDTHRLIDYSRPWALVMCFFLHHVTDEQDPVGVVDRFRQRMVPGCYFVSSNLLSGDHDRSEDVAREALRQLGTGHARPWATHRRFFAGMELVEPGLVYVDQWRPDPDTGRGPDRYNEWATLVTAGVGRKPS